MNIDCRYDAAQSSNDGKGRGWAFEPVAEPVFSIIRVLEVLFRPSSLVSLGLLALCVFMMVRF